MFGKSVKSKIKLMLKYEIKNKKNYFSAITMDDSSNVK